MTTTIFHVANIISRGHVVPDRAASNVVSLLFGRPNPLDIVTREVNSIWHSVVVDYYSEFADPSVEPI